MPKDKDKPKVLFLCTGNSCRSQMAEGWAHRSLAQRDCRALGRRDADVAQRRCGPRDGGSRGRHFAQRSKHVDDLAGIAFDYVVTVCDDARESCPVFPGEAKVIHHAFDDPPRLTENTTDDNERLAVYRRVRDEIRKFVSKLPENMSCT